MKVEIWSDYVCPFCYIGKKKFEMALTGFEHKEHIEVVFKSFELDPGADPSGNQSTVNMLAKKYGMSVEQAKAAEVNVSQQAAAVGITFYDDRIVTNTFHSHRLMHFAAAQGKDKELSERLFKAYFTDNDNIADRQMLIKLAGEVGLDEAAAAAVMESDEYSEAVREEESEAGKLGIRGVPFYVFDRKYAVSGAQSPDVFLSTLQKAWEEKYPSFIQVAEGDDDATCTDGVCAPKQP